MGPLPPSCPGPDGPSGGIRTRAPRAPRAGRNPDHPIPAGRARTDRRHGWRTWVGAVLAGALAAGAADCAAARNGFDLSRTSVPPEAIVAGGPPRDGIPSIDRPRFVPAAQARFLAPADRILGLTHHGEARAYPVRILNWHEIVNDTVGGEPVVITYCPLCGTGIAFRATVNGRRRTFGVSGLLYNSDVLLYDRETDSLWAQVSGRAISGPSLGTRLQMLVVHTTTWADWRRRHPDTRVLSTRTGFRRDYGRDPYAGYATDGRPWFPVRHSDPRLAPKTVVLGVVLRGHAKAYPFPELARSARSLSDTVGGRTVTVRFDATHRTARIFDAAGRELAGITGYWFAWYAFHPDTAVYRAP